MASLGSFGLDVGIYGPLADPQTILQLARHAEDTGFESIWLADHVAFPVSFKSEYPYGAKGVAEVNICPPMAAIANAIQRAIGRRLTDLPMSPPKALAAIDAQ